MRFSVYQVSRKGGRALNEDRVGYTYTREAVLLVLADGMGGHPEGEKAAEIAVRVFTQRFVDRAKPRLDDPRAFLEQTVLAANQAIVDYARSQSMRDNPRTTLVAAVVQAGALCALHSGDSRLYWVRQGHLVQRTRDHSYHDKPGLFRQLPPGVNRSVLFTCLGSDTPPLYDMLGPADLEQGDRLLLCSDGLWGVMTDDDVASGLHGVPLQDAVNTLANEAEHKGGRHGDNVSLLALEWDTADDFEPTQVVIRSEGLADRPFASSFGSLDEASLAAADAFDEDAIERTIAEINEAIRRTSLRKRDT
ncbi:PP2C family protein-serine/threonine phosphatase [Tepidicella baoligensis]|uniref:PP2C family protein-serine/threonine phosphatase n=1 Tax=Tepidicella baoligensis TaxID=2707016 RepID=UPI0015D98600|nr:PP2C family serine/threonine-protein phosphatase [Tepidicella baoligensis]